LTPHISGAWQKKIRGKIVYVGRWARRVDGKLEKLPGDEWWQPALELYKSQAADLHAGRTPRAKTEDPTLRDLGNAFLNAKLKMVGSGEITRRHFEEYQSTCGLLITTFGRDRLLDDFGPADFESLRGIMADRWGPVRLGNEIAKVKTVFGWGYRNSLVPRDPKTMYGDNFKKPSAAVLRKHRAKNGSRMLESDECRKLIDAAEPTLKAMVLLGLNAGFGNMDVATLPESALDLDGGWIDYARPKTGIARRCPLWPETVEALRVVLAERPKPKKAAEGLVFVRPDGRPWLTERQIANPVTKAVAELMKSAGVHRPGIGFYSLRHVFRTIADGARDTVAIDRIMDMRIRRWGRRTGSE
jgi:integrase